MGTFVIAGTESGITHVRMREDLASFRRIIADRWGSIVIADAAPISTGIESIREYFEGGREEVRATVQPVRISVFNLRVLRALTHIPYGETRTYGEMAVTIGNPGAARAVGNACGKNPVPIIVPCHRVTAAHGLSGSGTGLAVRRDLLALEGAIIPR